MRVAHVVPGLSAERGGPPRVILPLLDDLRSKGVRLCIYTVEDRSGEVLSVPPAVEHRVFAPTWLASWWRGHAHRLAAELRQSAEGFNLIHIHELWHYPHLVAATAASRSSTPYVVTVHGNLDPWALHYKRMRKRLYWRLAQRRLLAGASRLHAITAAEADHIHRMGLSVPVVVIPNGVSLKEFEQMPPPNDFRERHPRLRSGRIILFLGRLHPVKGLDLLAQAFSRIAASPSFRDVFLVVAGPDESNLRPKLEETLGSAGLLDRILFTGMLDARAKLSALAAADLFVLPSYSEGLSLATLEALACGVPVVITESCNFPEVAAAGAGEVVRADARALEAALRKVLRDEAMRARMGAMGRRLVEERYTWDKLGDRMLELYRDVLSERRERPGSA